jgi:formate hydrogenlyase subunit 3/multisubunit Na+/H+ antiporter MnhD subunit
LGAVTAVVGVLYAAYAKNLKRMLAFHTLSQIGYLVLGLAIATPEALTGVLDYAIAHGLFKGLLFLAAGEAALAAGGGRFADLTAHCEAIPRATTTALFVGTLAIVGLPPLAGFGAKAALFACHPSPFVFTVFTVTTVGTAFSFAKLLPLFRWQRGARRSDRTAAYAVLSVPILFFIPFTVTTFPSLHLATGLEPLLVIESLGAVAVGLLLHRWVGRRTIRLPKRLFYLEEAILAILVAWLVAAMLLRAV